MMSCNLHKWVFHFIWIRLPRFKQTLFILLEDFLIRSTMFSYSIFLILAEFCFILILLSSVSFDKVSFAISILRFSLYFWISMNSLTISIFVIPFLKLFHLFTNLTSSLLHHNWHSICLSAVMSSWNVSTDLNLLLLNALTSTHSSLLLFLKFLQPLLIFFTICKGLINKPSFCSLTFLYLWLCVWFIRSIRKGILQIFGCVV